MISSEKSLWLMMAWKKANRQDLLRIMQAERGKAIAV